MKKLVFFDLDGTIIDNPSSEKLFFCFLLIKFRLRLKQFLAAFLFLIKWRHVFKKEIFTKDKAYLAWLPVSAISELAASFIKKYLLARIRPRVRRLLDEHRQAGDVIILLTGSPDFIATIFAQYLSCDELCATKFTVRSGNGSSDDGSEDGKGGDRWNNDSNSSSKDYFSCCNSFDNSASVPSPAAVFSDAPPLQHPYAREKLRIAKEVCAKYGVKIEETIAYGNSIHDKYLLAACGAAVAVTPDKKLRRLAQAQGWRIVE